MMLTLLPLSGLHSALKRRNSKTIDFSRRDSISVYSTYSLPNSKSSMRRFSSFEELAPIFHLLSHDDKKHQSSKPKSSLSFRRSVKRSAPAASSGNSDAACADLDAQIARIKGQLAQLKNENFEMSQRVEDLSSSVESLYNERVPPPARVQPSTPTWLPKSSSDSSLGAIHEDRNESNSESEDEQSFEDYCQGLSRMIRKPSVPCPLPFQEVDIDPSAPSPKDNCIPNNILRPKAKSTPRLDIIRNDLSECYAVERADQRLSIVSCHSDSVVFTHRYRSSTHPFERTTDIN